MRQGFYPRSYIMDISERVGIIYQLDSDESPYCYIGQTMEPLKTRLSIHKHHAQIWQNNDKYSASRLYRAGGTLTIKELARLTPFDGETHEQFKRRLTALEFSYIRGEARCVNRGGKKYAYRHEAGANVCDSCGTAMASVYVLARHSVARCRRNALANTLAAIGGIDLSAFS